MSASSAAGSCDAGPRVQTILVLFTGRARVRWSDREGRAAAAGAGHVRVRELEARAVEALDEVDLGAVEVLVAQRIDVHLDALVLELLVHRGGGVLEVEVVVEPGAPAADDAQAQALAVEPLLRGDLLNLRGSLVGDRDHGGVEPLLPRG